MMEIRITGGIVTYNNAKTIKECVHSVLAHTKDCNFQLYVYDNCSTDNTVQILKDCFPAVIVLQGEKNVGFGQGHNQIIKRIKSDFHTIINPDIFVKTNVIAQMAHYMDKNPDIVQLTPEIRNLDGSVQYLPKRDPSFCYVVLSKLAPFKYYRKIYTMEDEIICAPTEIMSCTGCFSMIRTKTLKKIHGYDQRYFMYFEDADLSRRLRHYGSLVYHPELFVYHAWKRDNTRSIKGICIFLISMMKYYVKWR